MPYHRHWLAGHEWNFQQSQNGWELRCCHWWPPALFREFFFSGRDRLLLVFHPKHCHVYLKKMMFFLSTTVISFWKLGEIFMFAGGTIHQDLRWIVRKPLSKNKATSIHHIGLQGSGDTCFTQLTFSSMWRKNPTPQSLENYPFPSTLWVETCILTRLDSAVPPSH